MNVMNDNEQKNRVRGSLIGGAIGDALGFPVEFIYSYEDIQKLKCVEEMVETYYNSGQFSATISYIMRFFKSPFACFEYLGEYFTNNGLTDIGHSRIRRYEILLEAMTSMPASSGINIDIIRVTIF